MKKTYTLTIAATAVLACGFVYSEDLRSLVRRPDNRSSRVQLPQLRDDSGLEQFAQADAAQPEAGNAETRDTANASENAAGGEQTPNEVLASAKEKLAAYSSVRAKISEKIAMQSALSNETYRFGAAGEYLQGQNLKLKLTIEVKLSAELTGRLKEVCDGEVLYSSYELGAKEKPEITRRDVKQILQALEQAQQSARVPGRDRQMQQAGLIGSLGLGGLPALLAGFEKDFEFKKRIDEKIDDRDVVTIEGTWNASFLEAINPTKKGGKDKASKDKAAEPLPRNVPDVVRVSFDRETEFPRRIEYLKRAIGKTTLTPLMVMDLTDAKFNERLNRDEFVFFLPNDAKPRDDTQQYIQRISAMKAPAAGAGPQRAPTAGP